MSIHNSFPGNDLGRETMHAGQVAPLAPPKALLVATVCVVLVAVSALLSAVVALTTGREALRAYTQGLLDSEPGSGSALLDIVVEEAFGALQTRAYVWIFFAVAFLALMLPVRKGSTWARVVLTLLGLGTMFMGLRDTADMVSPLLGTLGIVIMLGTLVAVFAWWLPSVNRYAKTRKRMPAGR